MLSLLAACGTNTVNFDTLPDGTTVTGLTTGYALNRPPPARAVITNEYASEGITFAGPGVFVLAAISAGDTPSPPNSGCAMTSAGILGTPQEMNIEIAHRTCNVWFTLTPGSSPITLESFLPGSTSVSQSIRILPQGQPYRHNECGVLRVRLTGVNFCVDDVKVEKPR